MAATPQTPVPFLNDVPGAVNVTVLNPPAGDATNGNTCPNNGSLWLFALGTAADTITVTRPEGSVPDAVPVPANEPVFIGPFETDIYGPNLLYKVGATTTKVIPVQMPIMP